MTALEVTPSSAAALAALANTARGYIDASKAPATVKAYRADWEHFATWCDARGFPVLPAPSEVIALYLADLAGVKASATISRRLVSIRLKHRAAGHEDPTSANVVKDTWAGIRRTFGTAQAQKAPARIQEVRLMVAELDLDRLIGIRDRALLLVGFAAALRRSELVALNVADVDEREDGLVIKVARSKTDQEGAGVELGIPYGSDPATCPVRALRAWLTAAEIVDGPVFRSVTRSGQLGGRLSGRGVALVVKRTVERAGLDPARFAGHSLRAGLITSAAEAGVAERDIMRQSRHKSVPVMRRYIRGATLFERNAAASVGL